MLHGRPKGLHYVPIKSLKAEGKTQRAETGLLSMMPLTFALLPLPFARCPQVVGIYPQPSGCR